MRNFRLLSKLRLFQIYQNTPLYGNSTPKWPHAKSWWFWVQYQIEVSFSATICISSRHPSQPNHFPSKMQGKLYGETASIYLTFEWHDYPKPSFLFQCWGAGKQLWLKSLPHSGHHYFGKAFRRLAFNSHTCSVSLLTHHNVSGLVWLRQLSHVSIASLTSTSALSGGTLKRKRKQN